MECPRCPNCRSFAVREETDPAGDSICLDCGRTWPSRDSEFIMIYSLNGVEINSEHGYPSYPTLYVPSGLIICLRPGDRVETLGRDAFISPGTVYFNLQTWKILERKPSASPALAAPYDPESKGGFESYQEVANQIWSDKSNLEKEVEMLRKHNEQYRAAHKHLSAVDHRAIGDVMIENSSLKKKLERISKILGEDDY